MKKINPKKTTIEKSTVMLKVDVDIFAPSLADIFIYCVKNVTFAAELKLADMLPSFKSIDSTDKKNYRPSY